MPVQKSLCTLHTLPFTYRQNLHYFVAPTHILENEQCIILNKIASIEKKNIALVSRNLIFKRRFNVIGLYRFQTYKIIVFAIKNIVFLCEHLNIEIKEQNIFFPQAQSY